MADNTLNTYPILSVCATTGERVKELPIQDGQLIFVRDKHTIAFDYDSKRKYYHQIEEISSEASRKSMLAPISGRYYFVVETAVLWAYNGDWIQITARPEEIVFIGTEIPELGKEQTLYVNKSKCDISVYDTEKGEYIVVADRTRPADIQDIDKLFV